MTVNPAYVAREVTYVLRQSGAVGVFYAPSYRGVDLAAVIAQVSKDIPALRERIHWGEWDAFLDSGSPETQIPEPTPDDAVLIQYTSGTTGNPKGVLLNHRGAINSARTVAVRAGLEPGAVSINAMPLFHIGGCGTMELGTFSVGGTYVLLPGFDAGEVLRLVEERGGTVVLAVPTMLIALLEHPARPTRDLSSLRTVMTGGAAVPADLVRTIKGTFDCLFTITYGQTETSGPATQTSVHDTEEDQAETIGRVLPHMEVKIADPQTGRTLEHGSQGEICLRGYLVMMEYVDNPDATAQAIDAEGWLHTGDLGTMDDRGFLRITGRSKDMIIRGGEKIYPREIETVLFGHPAVSDVAVVGLPDKRWGEKVVAAIRLKEDVGAPSEQALRTWCEARLARYKIPMEWHIVGAFPQTPSAKIQKFLLREALIESSATRAERPHPGDDEGACI